MRKLPVWTMLPLILLGGCQSATQGAQQSGRPCPPRLEESGQCKAVSISSFPELSNIR